MMSKFNAMPHGERVLFRNFYRCVCGHAWQDIWDCQCNDRCGVCNREIEPMGSIEIEWMEDEK